jgi:hypothetical protein
MSDGTIQVPSLIADAIERVAELANSKARAQFVPVHRQVYASESETVYLVRLSPEGEAHLESEDRERRSLEVRLDSLASLAEFLASPPSAFEGLPAPLVTIEPDEVEVRYSNGQRIAMPLRRLDGFLGNPPLPYRRFGAAELCVWAPAVVARYNADGHERRHVVEMPLAYTEAYLALQEVFDGVLQKRLWTLLATDLQGCFPEAYEYVISTLSHLEKISQDVDIKRSGLANVKATKTLELTYKSASEGDQQTQVEVDWVFRGPLWTCFELPIEIPCRLVISKEAHGLVFQLFPKGLEALLLRHRAALAEEINQELSARGVTLSVYEGRA